MSIEESTVSLWIENLRGGDDESARKLWQRYFARIVRFARQKLPSHLKRDFDEEDVALSAMHSLCAGVARGQFPDLRDRDDLWALLLAITARKAKRRVRRALTLKRGSGRVRGESALEGPGFSPSKSVPPLHAIMSPEVTPEFAVQFAEESERMLDFLPDRSLRDLALLKMQGFTNREISQKLGCGERTVERRLALIRKLWLARSSET